MRAKTIVMVAAVSMMAFGTGCGKEQSTPTGQTGQGQTYGTPAPGQAQSDQAIQDQVKQMLSSEQGMTTPSDTWQMKVSKGQVTLMGTVATEADHEKILSAAKAVAGEGNVVDQLKVEKTGQGTPQTPAQEKTPGSQAPGGESGQPAAPGHSSNGGTSNGDMGP